MVFETVVLNGWCETEAARCGHAVNSWALYVKAEESWQETRSNPGGIKIGLSSTEPQSIEAGVVITNRVERVEGRPQMRAALVRFVDLLGPVAAADFEAGSFMVYRFLIKCQGQWKISQCVVQTGI